MSMDWLLASHTKYPLQHSNLRTWKSTARNNSGEQEDYKVKRLQSENGYAQKYRQTVWGIRGNSWVKHMKAPV